MERPTRFTHEELMSATSPLYSESRDVRFQEIDAAGVVFFATFADYFHDAYVRMLASGGLSLPRVLEEGAWGLPLVHAETDYLRPLRFGDTIAVEVVAFRTSPRAVTFGHRVLVRGKPSALGQTVHASIDRKTFSPIALPEPLEAALSRLANKPSVAG